MQNTTKVALNNNKFASILCNHVKEGVFLDSKNILWKWVDSKWIGKRSVWTFDFRACWLEDTTKDNIKSWWCGENVDYNEIFTKEDDKFLFEIIK